MLTKSVGEASKILYELEKLSLRQLNESLEKFGSIGWDDSSCIPKPKDFDSLPALSFGKKNKRTKDNLTFEATQILRSVINKRKNILSEQFFEELDDLRFSRDNSDK